MSRKYYSLEKSDQTATLHIYGEITSWPWNNSDVSSHNLSKQLEALGEVSQIDVYINSYGGEVAEGVAIYHALKRHKAKVRTICDGFACSIASVIFMAGDERIMHDASLLMIHNAWLTASGNAAELRKQADDLDKITELSVKAYKAHSSLTEDEIKALMDAESWIDPDEALEYGFATGIEKETNAAASQNAKAKLFGIIKAHQEKQDNDEEPDDDPQEDPENPPDDDSGAGDPEGDDPKEPEDPEDPEEPAEDEPEDDPEDDSEAKTKEEAAQMWSGFFNALKNM